MKYKNAILIALTAILLTVSAAFYADHRKNKAIIESTKVEAATKTDKELVRLAKLHEKRIEAVVDSLNTKMEQSIDSIQKSRKSLENERERVIVEYLNDTSCAGCCEDIIDVADSIVNTYIAEVDTLRLMNNNLDLVIQAKDSTIITLDNAYANSLGNIDILQKQIDKSDAWWARNKFYVGGGIGIVGTISILYLATKF